MRDTKTLNWFEVDRAGLAQLIAGRSKVQVVGELIANAWDAPGVTQVEVAIAPIPGRPLASVTVADNSATGFISLEHAWTLFAPSSKKLDATTRGRFNLGEKLVLSLCETAEITTTTGTVTFDSTGRHRSKNRRSRGTLFSCIMAMTREELNEFVKLRDYITPQGVTTRVLLDGVRDGDFVIGDREPLRTLTATLPTVLADEHGVLRPTARQTEVAIYANDDASAGWLYELGIPVVETGLPWHVNVHQKVPLNADRDNVPPAYASKLRTIVLDAMHDHLTPQMADAAWVTDALAKAEPQAVEAVLSQRFGEKRVSYDPQDPEANKRATAAGYTVVPGGALSGAAWANVKAVGAIKPAGQVMPTKHPRFSPDGVDTEVPRDEWTDAQLAVVAAFTAIGDELLRGRCLLRVRIVRDRTNRFAAWYGEGGSLTLNLNVLGHRWFEDGADRLQVKHVDLLIHELGHEWCADHLSSGYHDALTAIGARLALLVASEPKIRTRLQQGAAV